jgi:type I restriction enzyme S subunit
MKDWALHRFDEVFDLQMGKTPDRKTPQYFGGDNVWVSIRDMDKKEIIDSNEHITDEAVMATNIRKVKKGTVIMSFKLTVGKCAIAAKDLYTNEAIMAFNLKEGYDISADFLYYYLQGYKWEGANKAVMGMTLNKATISQHKIGFPPLSEQLSIVAELDKINELLSLKKAQLSDLDRLTHSIFFDMFGDPVENEKGWEVKKLGDICNKIGSGATPRGGNESYKNEGISLIRSLNVYNNEFKCKDLAFIDEKQADALSNVVVSSQDVLLNITGASVARCCIVPNDVLPARVNQHVCIIRPKSVTVPIYLNYLLTNCSYQNHLLSLAKSKAATREALPKSIVENLRITLPPLSLQQSFANRISAIEQQKKRIIESIKALETLLASRMQYWFD